MNVESESLNSGNCTAADNQSTASPVRPAHMRTKFQCVRVPFSNRMVPHTFQTGSSTPVILKPDKKFIESVYKRIEKLVQACQHPRLHLRNSPPYLLDILPDMYEKLKAIVNNYSGALDELFQTVYFQVFLSNLINKCRNTSRLFKDAKEMMYDEKSEYRHRLTKHSLVFSHILKDLEALYPNNRFSPEKFRITKADAAKWWQENFEQSPIVPWQGFKDALFRSFYALDKTQTQELQNTIDLACNDYVSIFEFDVFVRLFQPWNNVIKTWKSLAMEHAGYMAFMTYDEVKTVLKRYKNHPGHGSYVYRLSCTKLGQWAIGYIAHDMRILQIIITNKSLAQALIEGEHEGFYLYPNGRPSQSSILTALVENLSETHLQVSLEEYQIYSKMGSTFELCKICTENNKNIQLEPCGHLLCKDCLVNCQGTTAGQTCPFCRLEIKSVEEIVLDPFIPTRTRSLSGGDLPHVEDVVVEQNELEYPQPSTSNSDPLLVMSSQTCGCDHPLSLSSSVESVNQINGNPSCGSIEFDAIPNTCNAVGEEERILFWEKPEPPPVDHCTISYDPSTLMSMPEVIGEEGPRLTHKIARQLLQITEGNVQMASKIWHHFVPRFESS